MKAISTLIDIMEQKTKREQDIIIIRSKIIIIRSNRIIISNSRIIITIIIIIISSRLMKMDLDLIIESMKIMSIIIGVVIIVIIIISRSMGTGNIIMKGNKSYMEIILDKKQSMQSKKTIDNNSNSNNQIMIQLIKYRRNRIQQDLKM